MRFVAISVFIVQVLFLTYSLFFAVSNTLLLLCAQIGARDTHDYCNTCKAIVATLYIEYAICCCHEHIMPCYLSRLLDRSMKHHQISVFPTPCGKSRCCGCYWQMCLPCTASCTLCLIYREANLGLVQGDVQMQEHVQMQGQVQGTAPGLAVADAVFTK